VRDARTGAPIPGAVVRLAPRFGSVEGLIGDAPTVDADVASRRLPSEPDVAASADLSGRYALAGAPPRFGARGDAAATALAVAVAPGYAPAALRYAPPDAPGDGAWADAELAPEARATGRVVDAAGKPIPRARVRAAFSAVPSPNGGDVACAADPRPGEPFRFQSVVERATTTDADGRYRFAGLAVPPGETWTLRIFDDRPDRLLHVETPPVTVACPAGADVEAPDLTLPALPTYAVRVRALDRRGAPIAGAALSFVADPDYEEPLDAPRRTDADGRVELPAPSRWRRPEGRTPASEDGPTRLWLRVAAPGRATRFVPDVVLRRTEALGEETTVVLEEERAAEGVVVDAVGRPVPRAVVEARAEAADSRPGSPTAWYRRFAEARTDAEGRFTLRALPADPLTISARAPTPGERRADIGAMLFSRPVLSAPAGPFAEAIPLLRLTLPTQIAPDGGRLVVVLTEASGAPFSGSASAILVGGGREIRRATARPFGRATFDDVPPGTYDVAVAAASRRPIVVADVVVRTGERVEIAATLLDGLAASGVARTADGSPPPPGGRVFATSVDGRFSAHAELDADGRFVLSGLGPGRWIAQAERFAVAEQDEHRFASPRVPFDVAEGRATELALPMRPARHAKVVARGGAAHGADVGLRVLGLDGAEWLVSTRDGAERRGVADGGDFTLFGALPPGPCRIEFLRAGAPFSSRHGNCPDDLEIDVR
jgi:protocatechuate 3,4-dioxygenase beta subunit